MVLSSTGIDSIHSTVIQSPQALLGDYWHPLALPPNPLFGTDGIRGRVGDILTASLAAQVGYWAGRTLLTSTSAVAPVVLGQDSRNSSPALASALSLGLTAAGLEVWNLGLCPTPAVAYITHATSALGGVMISASHNPPEDNGIKFFGADGTKLSTDIQKHIEAALRQGNGVAPSTRTQQGSYYDRSELLHQYVESLSQPLLSQVNLRGMKIVLDLAWGAAAEIGPQVFANLGAEVICLHDAPDGDRINVNCGSTHLTPLKLAVQEHGAHLGFAFDGDADRAMAIDGQGRVVDGDYILYFWGQVLQRSQQLPNDTIISTVMANLGFERAWKRQGGQLVRTAVGDQYVHAEMLHRGAMLGGEQSGHILCRHYSVSGDGLLTALHLAAMVHQSGRSLSEMMDDSFQPYPQLLKNVRVENRERRLDWQNCEPLQTRIQHAEAAMGDRGRILVRASGTEPVIRVMVEAETSELAEYWTTHLVNAVQQYVAA